MSYGSALPCARRQRRERGNQASAYPRSSYCEAYRRRHEVLECGRPLIGECLLHLSDWALGFCLFVVWVLAARVVNWYTIDWLVLAFMGGVFEPPRVWLLAHWLGMTVLPFLLVLGGLPTAIQIGRGRPFKFTLLVSLFVCASAWSMVMTTIIWLPRLMGWHW